VDEPADGSTGGATPGPPPPVRCADRRLAPPGSDPATRM
jgi:hypothetical protein